MNILRRFFIRALIRRADSERDAGNIEQAAALYAEALTIRPRHAGLLTQHGHMRKALGDLAGAEGEYRKALRVRPHDADLHLQMGHVQKLAGTVQAAYESYRTARRLGPERTEAAREIAFLERSGVRDPQAEARDPFAYRSDAVVAVANAGDGQWTAAELARLVPSLVPGGGAAALPKPRNHLDLRGLGRRERTLWGTRRTLRGVEAVRGFVVCDRPVTDIVLLVNGLPIHRTTPGESHPVRGDPAGVFAKFIFNIWFDFGILLYGLHQFEVRAMDASGRIHSAHDDVVIAPPPPEALFPESDKLIVIDTADPRPLETQIRGRPNQVHPARRATFPNGIRNLLVMRPDQLGDLVASIPALQRLRALLPNTHIVGLLGVANAEFGRTLELFDEVIAVDFPDDRAERRRLMSLDEQEKLRLRLATYAFDVAIDLSQADVSRELLVLAGADFTFGTRGEDWPWLSGDSAFHTHDRWTGHDKTPHSIKVLALIESFGATLETQAPIIRRSGLLRDRLTAFGIAPGDRFALLHAGARIGFSRWPHYGYIAERLIRETDLKVILIADDGGLLGELPVSLAGQERFTYVGRRLPFDDFDALLSYATVMLGNDSGPKHLAALRGTKVVTLFSARINWTEWGQENVGVIISRKVPCAGCALLHDAEECGKGFACITDIQPDGVFDEMLKLVGGPDYVPL